MAKGKKLQPATAKERSNKHLLQVDTFGRFKVDQTVYSSSLPVRLLNTAKARQYYAPNTPRGSKPDCASLDGIFPRIPAGALDDNGFPRQDAGRAANCADCIESLKKDSRCKQVWELTVLLEDGAVALLSLGSLGQQAIAQYILRVESRIQGCREAGQELDAVDFVLTFETNKLRYGWSVRFPGPGSVVFSPANDSQRELFRQHNKESHYRALVQVEPLPATVSAVDELEEVRI